MPFSDLFNMKTTVIQVTAAPGGAQAPQERTEGVFLTSQSLATFPGATAAALIIWRVAVVLLPAPWSSAPWAPFVISVALGAFLWWIGIADQGYSTTEKIKRAGTATLNTLQIFAAVLGLPH